MHIETKQHTNTKEELLRKITALESLITSQADQLANDKLMIDKLLQENKTLLESEATSKWEHSKTKAQHTKTAKKLEKAFQEIKGLREEVRIARLPKNSPKSSLAPSSDLFKPKRSKNYSLRRKTSRKPGGQIGHPGITRAFSTYSADRVVEHAVESCAVCGNSLATIQGTPSQTHQVIDIAVPKKVIINHTTITKQCSCGHCNQADFPTGAKGQVNYSSGWYTFR